jgi:coproporphyrinogen III oxidase-like Fe-S oxidoreductase
LHSLHLRRDLTRDADGREAVDILKEHTVDRVSMGIQSFVAAESAAIYRPQDPDVVYRALEAAGYGMIFPSSIWI